MAPCVSHESSKGMQVSCVTQNTRKTSSFDVVKFKSEKVPKQNSQITVTNNMLIDFMTQGSFCNMSVLLSEMEIAC